MLLTSYDKSLVLVSILVAVLTSYTALDLAGRIYTATRRAARWWLAGGAVAMGFGIWSMHFIGMLALSLPIPLSYGMPRTFASLLLAIVASGFALCQTTHRHMGPGRVLRGALVLGGGIAAMHYLGMAAMHMDPAIQYRTLPLVASVLVAVAAAGIALKLAHALRRSGHGRWRRALAALVMGFAIVGMHYTGMAAAEFPAGSVCRAVQFGLEPRVITLLVLAVTIAVLAIALFASIIDARLEARTRRLVDINRQLKERSRLDSLTGLPNRLLLEDRLHRALARSGDNMHSFALMFIDLDGFKSVNDMFGHHTGDLLLVDVASRIRSALRGRDTIARLGGDEFVVLAQVSDSEEAASLAHRLNAAIKTPYDGAVENLDISASIGIALYPGDGASQHELMVNADAAMYHAKQAGRNTFSFFQRSMNANSHKNLALMHDIRPALARGEFELHYQPKVDALSGRLAGFEALMRWRHSTHGMISPVVFIGLAERSGAIAELGAWALREACRQLRAWHDAGHADWTIAVNLSALQFSNAALLGEIQDALREYGLPPASLTLEITESTAMHDVKHTVAVLGRIVELGVGVSIDDFGTGFSSLMYLKDFPTGELKIDRGFVLDLGRNGKADAIVAAIINLGHALGLRVVAEGVESEAQRARLTELGCDMVQGYFVARPMPAGEVLAFAREDSAAGALA